MRHRSWTISLIVMLCLFISTARAATPAGVLIENQASISYLDTATGIAVSILSNVSTVSVREQRRFTFESDLTQTVVAGQLVALPHQLHNVGNVADRYRIDVFSGLTAATELINPLVYVDSNNNGLIDSDEPVLAGEYELQPDETLSIVVIGQVPQNAHLLGVFDVQVQAQSAAPDPIALRVVDTLDPVAPAELSLSIASSEQCERELPAGFTVEYEINLSNGTSTPPPVRTLNLDGASVQGLLIELAIPAAMTLDLLPPSMAIPGVAHMIQTDGDPDLWQPLSGWDGLSVVDRVGVLLPASALDPLTGEAWRVPLHFLPSNAVDQAGSAVSIDAGIDVDGDGLFDVRSNTVCNSPINTTMPDNPEIRFVEPRRDLLLNAQAPLFSEDSDFVDTGVYRLRRDSNYNVSRDGVYVELNALVPEAQLLRDNTGTRYVFVDVQVLKDRPAATQSDPVVTSATKLLLRQSAPGSHRYRSIHTLTLSPDISGQPLACPGDPLNVTAMLLSGTQIMPDFATDPDTCAMAAQPNDWLSVQFAKATGTSAGLGGFSETVLRDEAIVDPDALVFDAITGEGIAGAKIEVFNGNQLATAQLTGETVSLTSDNKGRYSLPRLASDGLYTLRVLPPVEYQFPSTFAPGRFTRMSVSEASYGVSGYNRVGSEAGAFNVQQGEASPVIDIPLDPVQQQSILRLDKQVANESIAIGDAASYSLKVENLSEGDLQSVTVTDRPPFGFAFVSGSAVLDGATAIVPAQQDNGELVFTLDQLLVGESRTLEYRLRATPGAVYGDGINTASAQGVSGNGIVFDSSPSRARVNILQTGVLSNLATIFGKVYVDSSCDNLQNEGEWPIAGVRLYLQDGTFVITDEDGQYSVTGLQPDMHVIKVDPLSMPAGLSLKPLDTANGADAQSRFLDLSPGDFHRADFAASCPSVRAAEVFNELQQRNRSMRDGNGLGDGAGKLDDLYANLVDSSASRHSSTTSFSPDGDLSSNLSTVSANRADSPVLNDEVVSSPLQENVDQTAALAPDVSMADPKERVKRVTKAEALAGTFLWPRNEFSTDGRFMAVIRSGLSPTLYVNGKAVEQTQIGERIVNNRVGAEVIAWYGVTLMPGLNEVQIRAKDAFNNDRVLASAEFQRPAEGVRILLRTTSDTLPADGGRSRLPIDILVNDANGLPAAGVYYATVTSNAGSFVEDDLQHSVQGLQVRIENGRGKVHLRSGETTGRLRISAYTGALETSLSINQITASRPLLGAGFIQLGATYQNSDANEDHQARLGEEFEVDSRLAFFLKGSIRKNFNLTVSYDSDKPDDASLLRDPDPQELYSLFGDASRKGYEARSRSRLFLKLSRNRHSVMWGDYLTDGRTQLDDLSRVQRTLTGFNSLFDTGKTQVRVFAARQSDARESEEIRGNGTALLYQLSGAPIVANSEVVELVVRDRDNLGLIVSSEQLIRFTDYTLDPVSGLLSFSNTVPSVDSELNPVFLRISYDRESNFSEHTVAGLRVQHQIGESTQIGLSVTDDAQPATGSRIVGVHAQTRFARDSTLSVSSALQTHTGSAVADEQGEAQRIKLAHRWTNSRGARTSLQWAKASEHFDNPGSGIIKGQREWQFEHFQPLGKGFDATLNALRSESVTEDRFRQVASLQVSRAWQQFSLKAGLQRMKLTDSFDSFSVDSVLLGAEKRFSLRPSQSKSPRMASVSIEHEQDIADSSRYRQSATARIPLRDFVSAYARYEDDQGLGAQTYTFNEEGTVQLTAGVESDIAKSTRLYSEYRMRGAFNGRSMETASGVRGRYVVREGLSFSPSLEFINAVQGADSEDSLAVSLGMRDTQHANRRIGVQLEWRKADSSRYTGFRASLVQRLSLDWTALLRDQLTRQTNAQGQKSSRHELTLGLSRRPKTDNRHHALYTLKFKSEELSQDQPTTETWVASTVQNRALSANWTLSGRLGFKHQSLRSNTVSEQASVWLTDVRSTVDIARRWELDVRAGALATDGSEETLLSFGTGLAWLFDTNARLSVRYNWLGFEDADLDEQAFNVQGLKLGLTYKFDESQFGWLEPKR